MSGTTVPRGVDESMTRTDTTTPQPLPTVEGLGTPNPNQPLSSITGTSAEQRRYHDFVSRHAVIAIEAVRAAIDDGHGAAAPQSAYVVHRAAELLLEGGRLFWLACERPVDQWHSYIAALQAIGAPRAAAMLHEAARLMEAECDTADDLERLDVQLDDHDPPLLGLLAEFLASREEPWFDQVVSAPAITLEVAKIDDRQALLTAIDVGSVRFVERALAAARELGLSNGTTFLHRAVWQRPTPSRVQVARLLLDAGVPVDTRDEHGITALNEAAMISSPAFVELLLARGADPNADCQGYPTALHRAEHPESIRLLLNAGALPNARMRNGETALHFARRAAKVKLLLDAGADPRARCERGTSTLHHNVDAETVRLLVAAGVDPNATDDAGETPLMCQSDVGAVEALLALGARLDAVDHEGRSVLHQAYQRPMNHEVWTYLLERGADPTARDHEGKTPLELAREFPLFDVLERGRARRCALKDVRSRMICN
jgi:ankyrin repeat protein